MLVCNTLDLIVITYSFIKHMKIKKIQEIKSLGVFSSFEWDDAMKNKKGNVITLNQLNIIYGRNYSGKTTLSRIFRYMENGNLSESFQNSSFSLLLENDSLISKSSLVGLDAPVRVFNEDFCLQNLSFCNDFSDKGEIKSFAVIGSENNKIIDEIESLKEILGCKMEDRETGLYKQQKQARQIFNDESKKLNAQLRLIDDLLQKKATKGKDSIKILNHLYGDINYNVTKLKSDIEAISRLDYKHLSKDERLRLISLVQEAPKEIIPSLVGISEKYKRLLIDVRKCLNEKVLSENKIAEFLLPEVAEWARMGHQLHECSHEKCKFCGGIISMERWQAIANHFDESSEKLVGEIDALKDIIKKYIGDAQNLLNNTSSLFYANYRDDVDRLIGRYLRSVEKHKSKCDEILALLDKKRNSLVDVFAVASDEETVLELDEIISEYNKLADLNNQDTRDKKEKKKDAQTKLRLDEVLHFVQDNGYFEKIDAKRVQEEYKSQAERNKNDSEKEVLELETKVQQLEASMVDESKGVNYINSYLSQLKNCTLKLAARQEANGKIVCFYVVRNGKEAHNLSEGERKIIAFCYFLAKLKDVNTEDKHPIVWIDDPICSLDSNHVFFVYSLIRNELTDDSKVEQLFISTHNLEFLKYLKRLLGTQSKMDRFSTWMILERAKNGTSIRVMPDYMKKHVTEFEYLFEQICLCVCEPVSDENYPCFYNFGNNARKFLEIYLYYKYPEKGSCVETISDMFGSNVSALLTDRINNEMSHLDGGLERGSLLVELPEIRKSAMQILSSIKNNDSKQYESLLKSVRLQDPLAEEKIEFVTH